MDRHKLRWVNHLYNFKNEFQTLLEREALVDVTLVANGHKIRCHKVVLSSCSVYFENIFYDNPCQHPVIVMHGIGFQELHSLITFVYNGEVELEMKFIPRFLKIAKSLQIKGLAHLSENHIRNVAQQSLKSISVIENHDKAHPESVVIKENPVKRHIERLVPQQQTQTVSPKRVKYDNITSEKTPILDSQKKNFKSDVATKKLDNTNRMKSLNPFVKLVKSDLNLSMPNVNHHSNENKTDKDSDTDSADEADNAVESAMDVEEPNLVECFNDKDDTTDDEENKDVEDQATTATPANADEESQKNVENSLKIVNVASIQEDDNEDTGDDTQNDDNLSESRKIQTKSKTNEQTEMVSFK